MNNSNNSTAVPLTPASSSVSSSSSSFPKCQAILAGTDSEICGSLNIDKQLHEHFNELVCYSCKSLATFPLSSSSSASSSINPYRLLSKQEAMKELLIPADAFQLFKFLPKPNPHNPHWQPMKLYLTKQLLTYSLLRYGGGGRGEGSEGEAGEKKGLEGLEEEKKKREEKKYAKALAKTERLLEEKNLEFQEILYNQKKRANGGLEGVHDEEERQVEQEKERAGEPAREGAADEVEEEQVMPMKGLLSPKKTKGVKRKGKEMASVSELAQRTSMAGKGGSGVGGGGGKATKRQKFLSNLLQSFNTSSPSP